MNATRYLRFGALALAASAVAWLGGSADAGLDPENGKDALAIGKELFTREWLPGDKRSLAGNGLGPVFNGRSCLACHFQGGTGGSGPNGSNATIVGAFVDLSTKRMMNGIHLVDRSESKDAVRQPDREKLAEIHPALRTGSSFPVHRFSADKEFETWKSKHFEVGLSTGFFGGKRTSIDGVKVALIPSERNTPPLFGVGLIERIPVSVLEAIANEQAAKAEAFEDRSRGERQPLPVSGRLVRLKDGRVGRFGWKNNVATLRDFTLQACSNELGLEVPGFPRAVPPWVKDYKGPGLDLSADQCDRLVEFVAALPRPISRAPQTPEHAAEMAAGQNVFEAMGCAVCHRPNLGNVDGIYSDLLLHDMGQALSGSGSYGTNVEFVKAEGTTEPLAVNRDDTGKPTREKPPKFGAGAREWRTPPLWGLHDSAPYLHDGRADTIERAILQHDGEGAVAEQAYEKLSSRERMQLDMFLQSLAAPPMK